jgi:hypothetical protein
MMGPVVSVRRFESRGQEGLQVGSQVPLVRDRNLAGGMIGISFQHQLRLAFPPAIDRLLPYPGLAATPSMVNAP